MAGVKLLKFKICTVPGIKELVNQYIGLGRSVTHHRRMSCGNREPQQP